MIPTLFVSESTCIVVYWESYARIGFPCELIPEFFSAELQETYRNVLSLLNLFHRRDISWGVTITKKSLEELQQKKLYLSGESIGLAWLIGGLCFLNHLAYPSNLMAWGAIRPLRNGHFFLYPTEGTDKKLRLTELHFSRRIAVHKDETTAYFPGERIVLGDDMMENINILEERILQCSHPQ